MSHTKKHNLFVYGSLREASIFESVCGLTFSFKIPALPDTGMLRAELALLPQHRRISPDNVYFYAVPDKNAKIQGFVIYDIPDSAMDEIDKYEGKAYAREKVTVHTANGKVETLAYLVEPQKMKKKFGERFHINLIHELWLRKRIERYFNTHTRPGEHTMDADIERRAKRELLGTTERDLVISHLGQDSISDFFIEHELDRPIPSIKKILKTEPTNPFMNNYLALVIKQVLLNQFETMIHQRYRFELDRMSPGNRYFNRTVGVLAALKMVNANKQAVELILKRGLETMPPDGRHDLIDYVKYAVNCADNAFDPRVARSVLQQIRSNYQPGLVPMGCELELSNLGFRAIYKDTCQIDSLFDGFRYFDDFALDVLSWKVGGYIDDHSGSHNKGKRGFLELAPGRLNILGELSKPATSDPWVLSQIIHEISVFYPVAPHSLHLSFQIRKHQIDNHSILPLSFVKCLMVLGGGTQQLKRSGRLRISRMDHDEIQRDDHGRELIFARTSKRRSKMHSDGFLDNQPLKTPTYINQYKFIRLEARANYEPLIMALKGLQLSMNPGDFITPEQYRDNPRLRREFNELQEWAANPTPISRRSKGRFLDMIHQGLMNEAHHKPYHKLHYIDWTIGAIDLQIRLFNKALETPKVNQPPVPVRQTYQKVSKFTPKK